MTVTAPVQGSQVFQISVDYTPTAIFGGAAHGITDIVFTEPAGDAANGNGFRFSDFRFQFTNDLGVPVDGFVLYNANESPPATPDVGSPHPTNYAHFHGVEENTFAPLESRVLLQDFVTPANFGPVGTTSPEIPTYSAPGQIQASGTIQNGQTINGASMTLHQGENTGVNDSFHIAFFPILDSGQELLAMSAGELTLAEGTEGTTTTYTFTALRGGASDAINANTTTVDYSIVPTGTAPVDASDFVAGTSLQGTLTFAPGENSKTIDIVVAGDSVHEGNETFVVTLSNPSGAAVVVDAGAATGTVTDDDPDVRNLTDGNDQWPGPAFPSASNGGNETINGLTGNDVITPGAGDDTIDGGPGFDTAVWSSARQYTAISISPGAADTVTGPDGTDTATNIESFVFLDGQYIADATHPAAQVHRLYDAALDRAPDMDGLKAWTNALTSNSQTLQQVANGFTTSAEFQQRYGDLDNGGFVTLLYQNVLDRAPDAPGLAAWQGALNAGMTRAEALVGFSESPENVQRSGVTTDNGLWLRDDQAATIARLYDSVFDRLPDPGGLGAWKGAVQSGLAYQQVAEGFTNSAEFQEAYGTLDNAGFVRQLYLNVLDREADPGGFAAWKGALDAGVGRASVVLDFSESREHQIHLAGQIDDGIWLL
ncbi:hypothetical protein N825_27420 [Skermanella stibiiresistens SB22]|uniref:Calx-beta domain-containing protein n=1 Tax=Skermanella stibiiresistens SB22 TaxID=1385369 RepID=W9H9R3_9PROT|nr:hypothetical protein N825_27420 [Skermanella stibiiresistens SB22]